MKVEKGINTPLEENEENLALLRERDVLKFRVALLKQQIEELQNDNSHYMEILNQVAEKVKDETKRRNP